MKDIPEIPIKNIYYMLCYAWDLLEELDSIPLDGEEFDNIYNLLGRIYINGTSKLIKRGMNSYYIEKNEMTPLIRGRIKMAESIKTQSYLYGGMVCQFDEFSNNIKLNQIIKTTINMLIGSDKLDDDLRKRLFKIRVYFSNIEDIRLSDQLFSSLRYDRSNHHYRMLIKLSELIYKGLVVNEKKGEYIFLDFIKDDQMAKLYEKFVLNFYKIHLDRSNYKVHSPRFKWKLDGEISKDELALLPEMRTDIVIENRKKGEQIIIDTKYYRETLTSNMWTDVEKIRSEHLYQIFAYVNNSQYPASIKGILLYPSIEKEVNASFPIGGKEIGVRTLNLNADWTKIEDRLLSLIP